MSNRDTITISLPMRQQRLTEKERDSYRSDNNIFTRTRAAKEVSIDQQNCGVCELPIEEGALIFPHAKAWIHATCRVETLEPFDFEGIGRQ